MPPNCSIVFAMVRFCISGSAKVGLDGNALCPRPVNSSRHSVSASSFRPMQPRSHLPRQTMGRRFTDSRSGAGNQQRLAANCLSIRFSLSAISH